ncbi:bobby sox isoform X2 [Rhynchophorus ferrugineus]
MLSNLSFMEPYSNVQNSQMSSVNEKKIGEVWSTHNFDTNKVKIENLMKLNNVQNVWGATRTDSSERATDKHKDGIISPIDDQKNEEVPVDTDINVDNGDGVIPNAENSVHDQEESSPPHHARRPPNAFLIFCKKHRRIVRQRYPTTENRGVTKILGEWWALLWKEEKQPYTDLANEYKDAFLTANPGFKWYKLPAPSLRTLTPRPTTISKPSATISSPPSSTLLSEFTPGKLADESQLGGLTSLMNNNFTSTKRDDPFYFKIENNNNENPQIQGGETNISEKLDEIFSSPTTTIKPTLPPKPIKKRFSEQHEEDKSCSKNIFHDGVNKLTKQDIFDKVVDDIFENEKDELKEHRKSDRMCKGKRYERFMVEGKLLGNKRDTKLTQHNNRFSCIDSKIEQELTLNKPVQDVPNLNLENTIKRLKKRTNIKVDLENEEDGRTNKIEASSNEMAKSRIIDFNLELRIDNLPSLNYDDFMRRKRESKKRKMKIKTDTSHNKAQKVENSSIPSSSSKPQIAPVVGSKKRKNKQSITHLNKNKTDDNALFGLETLAMVAASTEKIGENTQM